MPIKISAIKCEFCELCFAAEEKLKIMTEHEKTCVHNPSFKACATCKNWWGYVSTEGLTDACAIEDGANNSSETIDFWHMDHIKNGNCKYWEAAPCPPTP